MLFNSLAYFLLVGFTRIGQIINVWPAWFMILGSIIFYAFAGPLDMGVFVASVILNWLITIGIKKDHLRIIVAVIFNIGLLFFFKYQGFFLSILGPSTIENRSYIDLSLPLGISFYTFQILAYHIDVVKNETKKASSFSRFFLFISFFPQLVAGPIVRAKELLPQIERLFEGKRRKVYLYSFGISLFTFGLFKKVFLADSIAPHVDEIFLFGPQDAYWAWLGAFLFSFQIYCDFSGYSDMAIGSAFLLGIKLPLNFKTPYLSAGPRDFWQRWHITLSTWIRDYLYIPLGGSRGGAIKAAFVLILTMSLAGLWHGADFTFVLWGFCWGIYIYMARFAPKLPSIVTIIPHFILITLLWVLFRSPDMSVALDYYSIMFGLNEGKVIDGAFFNERALFLPLLLFTGVLYGFHILENKMYSSATLYRLKKIQGPYFAGFIFALALGILLLQMQTNANPFIYFRF